MWNITFNHTCLFVIDIVWDGNRLSHQAWRQNLPCRGEECRLSAPCIPWQVPHKIQGSSRTVVYSIHQGCHGKRRNTAPSSLHGNVPVTTKETRREPVFAKQCLTYLRLLDKHLGFVINFGVPSLKDGVERVVNNIQKDFAWAMWFVSKLPAEAECLMLELMLTILSRWH